MGSSNRTFFLANVCHVCKSKETCYVCEVCRMVYYCSLEHRRENWLEHSNICWAVNKVCQERNVKHALESFDGRDFTAFRHGVATRCMGFLGRSLKPWEFEMIYYPRVCEVCREFNREKLQRCKACEFAFTCQKHSFRKDHSKWCQTLKLYSDLVIYESLKAQNGTKVRRRQFEMENVSHKSMMEVLHKVFDVNESEQDLIPVEIEKALVSELLTYPLTVLHSLKQINAFSKKYLSILFIGAEVQAEVEPLIKWEKYFFHFLSEVERLNLIFLGPELSSNINTHSGDLCESCRNQSKELKYQFVSGKFYHEYSNKCDKPDLICALNSGMYRDFGFKNENSWEETIRELFMRGNTPALITEYTCHELKKDLEKIKNLCGNVSFIVQPKMNPFASLKPGLNIISENETPVIFKNYFYVILKSPKKK